jgi:AcrR family transcriptional regulator
MLREAMLSLVLEKGYDAVTIEDITERADLGRTTFYLHYHDKEDLLLESLTEVADELKRQILEPPLQGWPPVVQVFRHASENAHLYRIILSGQGVARTEAGIRALISKEVVSFIQNAQDRNKIELDLQVPLDIFSNYFAGALLSIIRWWLEEDQPYPPEEMALMFRAMFFGGAITVLNLPDDSMLKQ